MTVQHSSVSPHPVVLGHEASGWVESVGEGVDHLAPGDPVVCTVAPACGHCYFCSRGRASLCDQSIGALLGTLPGGGTGFARRGAPVYRSIGVGAFTDYVVMPAGAVVAVPADTPLELACLLGCGVGTGLGASLNTAGVTAGDSVVVFGLGGVGIAAVQGARIAGATCIVGVDPVAERRERAAAFGVTDVVDPSVGDVVRRVRSVTRVGADHAIETAGRADAMAMALDAVCSGGTVTLVGVPSGDSPYVIANPTYAILTEKRIQGCAYGSSHPHRDVPRYLAMARAGLLDLENMVTARRPLDEVSLAFEDLTAGRGLRTVIDL